MVKVARSLGIYVGDPETLPDPKAVMPEVPAIAQ
jgi:6-phosphofructokinase 1